MDTRRLIAYLLLALGAVTLLGRLSGGSGWLWIAVVAVSFLYAWRRERTYGLLVIGSILAGMSAGILLEGNFGWDGAFLVGLGAGFLGIDLVEPRRNRWPRIVGAIVAVAGLVLGVAEAGILGSTWFAVLLILAGIWLVARRDDDGWVHVGPPPGAEAAFDQEPQPPADPSGPEPSIRWVEPEAAREATASGDERGERSTEEDDPAGSDRP